MRYLCLSMPDWLAKLWHFHFCYIVSRSAERWSFQKKCFGVLILQLCTDVYLFVYSGSFFSRKFNVKGCFLYLFVCVLHRIFFHLWNPFDKKIKLFYFFSGNVSYLRQGHYFHWALQSNKDAKITKLKKSSFPWSWWAAPKTNDFWMQTSTFQDIYPTFF